VTSMTIPIQVGREAPSTIAHSSSSCLAYAHDKTRVICIVNMDPVWLRRGALYIRHCTITVPILPRAARQSGITLGGTWNELQYWINVLGESGAE
jgi:hypothetical protein